MTKKTGFLILLSCSLVLLGRGYQYIFWDTPIRALMWHQDWMEPVVNLFGVEWTDYASSPFVDKSLNVFSRVCGWLFLLTSLLVWFYHKFEKLVTALLKISFGVLLFIFLLDFKDQFFRIGYFIEHSIQLFSPLIFLWYKKGTFEHKYTYVIQCLTALTFIGHGLYAIGYYPHPGEFIDYFYYVIKFDEQMAKKALMIIGIVDIIFSIVLFLPTSYLERHFHAYKLFLYYFIVWGFLTAFVRIITGFSMSITSDTIHQELYKTVFRLSHGILPLVLFLVLKSNHKLKDVTLSHQSG
jgi:hypothetical protein